MFCCVAPRVGVRNSQSTLFCVAPQVGVGDSQSTRFCVAPRFGVKDSHSTLCCVAPRVAVRDSQSTHCCVASGSDTFSRFLGKCGKGRFPVSQIFHPAHCPNPNPCVPKPKPIPMQWPQSDANRHPGKHSPQSDVEPQASCAAIERSCSCAPYASSLSAPTLSAPLTCVLSRLAFSSMAIP